MGVFNVYKPRGGADCTEQRGKRSDTLGIWFAIKTSNLR